MSHRVHNALALLAAVVCLASAIAVARSFFRVDQAGLSLARGHLWLAAIDAQLVIAWEPAVTLPPSFDTYHAADLRPALDTVWEGLTGIRRLGIGWNWTGVQDERLVLPLWLLPLLSAIPAAHWWRSRHGPSARGFEVQIADSA